MPDTGPTAVATMRAAVFHEYGGPDVVRLEDVPVPEPGPGEVRVAVKAAAMNHLDLWVRRGLPIEHTMPHIGGSDLAGVVDAVGQDARWREGGPIQPGVRVVADPSLHYGWYDPPAAGSVDRGVPLRLVGEHTDGGFADFCVVPAENLVEVPAGVSLEKAAAAALVFVTAWHGLRGRAAVREGDRVLVTGGSGGVATAGIQIARHAGATVLALTSGPENVERVRELGAHHAYDRLGGDWVAGVRRDTAGAGVDVILDSVGGPLWHGMMRVLGVGGRLVSYGATAGAKVEMDLRHVFWKQLSFLGSTMGSPGEFREVMGLVFQGEMAPVIQDVLPLEDARRAHEMLESGKVFGKLVLVP
ncbi:MAG: zinc-binding dehydrogenase [Gemmatimonadales bacterium]|nr:MAG: zinc-binding dehydrogenase [Gemmatimonadales bacterium]